MTDRLPAAMVSAIGQATAWRGGAIGWAGNLPTGAGAYAIAISLARATDVTLRGRVSQSLAPGAYIYCGSARGPGGLKARLARHLRHDKVVHWHIDWLTTAAGSTVVAWPAAERGECEVVGSLLATGLFDAPIPGFGSSDCRRCESHLLAFTG